MIWSICCSILTVFYCRILTDQLPGACLMYTNRWTFTASACQCWERSDEQRRHDTKWRWDSGEQRKKDRKTYLCGGEREKPEHSAAGEVLMIITTTKTLAMDIYRYAPADVTLPFVSCQVPVKLLKTSRLTYIFAHSSNAFLSQCQVCALKTEPERAASSFLQPPTCKITPFILRSSRDTWEIACFGRGCCAQTVKEVCVHFQWQSI